MKSDQANQNALYQIILNQTKTLWIRLDHFKANQNALNEGQTTLKQTKML